MKNSRTLVDVKTMTPENNGYPAMDKKNKDPKDKPPVRGEYKACLADMRLDAFYARIEKQHD